MYIYTYLCIYIDINTYIYIYMFTYKYIYVHIRIHTTASHQTILHAKDFCTEGRSWGILHLYQIRGGTKK